MNHLRLVHPEALLLLVPLAAAFALWRRRLGGLWTLAAAACLVVALGRPQWRAQVPRVARIAALDVSGSTFVDSQAALAAVRESLGRLGADDRAGVAVFGASPAVVVPLSAPGSLPRKLSLPAAVPRTDATDIAAVIELAAGQFADDGRDRQLVILTDGRETRDRAAMAAALAADAGLRVFVVPVAPADVADARVAAVRAPLHVRVGEPFELSIEVAATAAIEARLSVTRDGEPVGSPHTIELAPGLPRRLALTQRLTRPGPHVYAAQLSLDDRCSQNNLAEAVVTAEGATRVLCLSRSAQPQIARLLASSKDLSVAVAPAKGGGELAARLARADCLVIDDVAAAELEPSDHEAVREWVRHAAGGLVAVGGPSSFGPGGYAGSPIEQALPVLCSRPRTIALLVVLDHSGSMGEDVGGRQKIAFARDAVLRAARELRPTDRFGLLAFAAEPEVVVPPGPIPPRETLERCLEAIRPHGPTELQRALERTLELLAASPAPVRHAILVSDGQASRLDTAALRKRYADAGVTLSALMTGTDPEAIARIQELTGATFHRVTDIARLAPMLLEALRRDTYAKMIRTGETAARRGPAPLLVGDAAPAGPLGGYVRTVAKRDAAVEWLAAQSADPILARWRFGLGRAVAFTSTVGTQWDAGFWPPDGAASLWQRVVRWAARPPRREGFEAAFEEKGDTLALTVRAERDGRFVNGLQLSAHVVPPQGDALDVPLPQTAPGEYQAAVPAPRRGVYHVTVAGEGGAPILSASTVRSYAMEWEAFGVDAAALEAIARNGRGRVLPSLDALRSVEARGGEAAVEADWAPFALALVLFVAGVAAHVFRARRASL